MPKIVEIDWLVDAQHIHQTMCARETFPTYVTSTPHFSEHLHTIWVSCYNSAVVHQVQLTRENAVQSEADIKLAESIFKS
jgi:hypothetical protein